MTSRPQSLETNTSESHGYHGASLVSNHMIYPTPPPSNHDNPVPLAERRKTQVSNYLVSKDFKTDFAIKLNHLRQRELNLSPNNTTSSSTATTPNHTTTTGIVTSTIQSLSYNLLEKSSPYDLVTPPKAKARCGHASSDQNSMKEDGETEGGSSISSIRKGGVGAIESSRSSRSASIMKKKRDSCLGGGSRGEQGEGVEEEETLQEQNARYEVIRKLADQLASKMEENDDLLYELGVVRSHNARLKALEVDQSDELTCLKQRIRNLESIIAINNLNPSASDLAHLHNENRVYSLNSHLQIVRNQLVQLHQQFSKPPCSSRSSSSTRSNPRHSWPSTRPKCAWSNSPTINPPLPRLNHSFDHIHFDEKKFDFLSKIHQLEVELFECHEARIASGVTVKAMIDCIDKASESGIEEREVTTSDHLLQPSLPIEDSTSRSDREAQDKVKTGENETAVLVTEPGTSPLMSLASFTFSGWGRKASGPTTLEDRPSTDSGSGRIPSRSVSISDHQLLSPPSIDDPILPLKSFGFRSIFNYSTHNHPLNPPDSSRNISSNLLSSPASPLSAASVTTTSLPSSDSSNSSSLS